MDFHLYSAFQVYPLLKVLVTFTYSYTHSYTRGRDHLRCHTQWWLRLREQFGIQDKDTSTRWLEGSGTEPPILQSMDDPSTSWALFLGAWSSQLWGCSHLVWMNFMGEKLDCSSTVKSRASSWGPSPTQQAGTTVGSILMLQKSASQSPAPSSPFMWTPSQGPTHIQPILWWVFQFIQAFP